MKAKNQGNDVYAHDYWGMPSTTKANISMSVNLSELLKNGFVNKN